MSLEPAHAALLAVALLLTKHAIADFILQTPWQYLNKGRYGHPGGLLHSLTHVVMTPIVYLVLAPATLMLAAWLAIGEFVMHYHIDWAKEQFVARNHWTTEGRAFWWALGIDQLLHGLSYLIIVLILLG